MIGNMQTSGCVEFYKWIIPVCWVK